jgi:hypothetical protein
VADGEDAAVQRMQPPQRDTMIDRAAPDAQRRQLRPRHHAVLARREVGDLGIDGSSRTFAMDVNANVRLDRHGTIVAIPACRITTGLHQSRGRSARAARAHPLG